MVAGFRRGTGQGVVKRYYLAGLAPLPGRQRLGELPTAERYMAAFPQMQAGHPNAGHQKAALGSAGEF